MWRPKEEQWWITGFTGNKHHTTADKLVMVGTINFSGKENYYESLKNSVIKDSKLRNYMLFDDKEKKVWILWWDQNGNIK